MWRAAPVVTWPLAVAFMLAAAGPVAAEGGFAAARITVRVYERAALTRGARDAALAQAVSVLSKASVEATFRVCGPAGSPPPGCDVPLAEGEMTLRLLGSPVNEGRRVQPLGAALIDRQSGRGVLATVYVDPIARMARGIGGDVAALLGRVIAHELGHLLVPAMSHHEAGLMRAVWSPDDLRRRHAFDWSLPSEVADAGRADEAAPSRGSGHSLHGPARVRRSRPVTRMARSGHSDDSEKNDPDR